MPSRAYTSFLPAPFTYMDPETGGVNALSGLYLISTLEKLLMIWISTLCVNALSGLYLISTTLTAVCMVKIEEVSMPSRAYTSFLLVMAQGEFTLTFAVCQCPLGLIPHFYEIDGVESWVKVSCQCPLGLIPHFY